MKKRCHKKDNATRIKVDGRVFSSEKKAQRYIVLKQLLKQDIIRNLRVHPSYLLQAEMKYAGKRERAVRYIADFEYQLKGKMIVEDIREVETQVFKLKRLWFLGKYPKLQLRILH
jgi:hypothetical protein